MVRIAKLLALAPAALLARGAMAEVTVAEGGANPIRKVVTMLQAMQKKVEKEGEKEKELYEAFMCHCQTGGGDLTASIASAETKIPDVTSNIEASEGKLEQTKADLKSAQTDRTAAKDAMSEATALREKEAAAFALEESEYKTNVAAITKAVTAIENGMSGSFLQTAAAQLLRNLVVGKVEMLDGDRQELVAFLSEGASYAPASGEISGILKEMGDSMAKHLEEITNEEKASIKTFEELMNAKKKEVKSLSTSIETKTQQIGELGVAIVQMKEDLSDTQAALVDDQKYYDDLKKSCSTKTAEWEERSKTRADELVALADTIKILNDDDALDLFKSTLPGASASFVQLRASSAAKLAKAAALIETARAKAPAQSRASLDLLGLALLGKRSLSQGGFDKVIKMVDNMVATLKQEQHDDDNKKEYCSMQLDAADDKRKGLERSISDKETAIASAEEGISTLTSEIAALEAGIKALDKSVAEATEQRKSENVEYKQLMASNGAAKELLEFAKNRLNKFYNPKLHKPSAKAELSEAERINVNIGGEADPTAAPGGIAGTGVTVFAQVSAHKQLRRDAPAPPPETWGAYQKKSGESQGVVAMLNLLVRDLEKEMTEAETSEKTAQEDYEQMMSDSAAKRAADTKSLTEKGSSKAELETDLQGHKDEHKSSVSQHMATVKYIQNLHGECDWLMQYYDVRKAARADEVDSLNRAKAVLSGADYSFAQVRASLRGASV